MLEQKSQSILISGESGAGKTEVRAIGSSCGIDTRCREAIFLARFPMLSLTPQQAEFLSIGVSDVIYEMLFSLLIGNEDLSDLHWRDLGQG